MKPIRSNELEYYEKLIDNKFRSQNDALNRKLNNEIDKVVEKTFKPFKKRLNMDTLIAKFNKARKEYSTFKQTKEIKENELKMKALEEQSKLKSFLKQKSESNNWNLDINTSSYSHREDSFYNESEIDDMIKDACKVEARRFVEKQPVAKDINALDDLKERARNILYSGNSISATVSELSKVFKQGNIQFQIPSNLLQIEAPKK